MLSVCILVCTLTHRFSHPRELGAHFLSLFDHASLQHILGTLGIDESVSGVQSLGLIHPLSGLSDIPSMLWEGKGQSNSHNTRQQPRMLFSYICYSKQMYKCAGYVTL